MFRKISEAGREGVDMTGVLASSVTTGSAREAASSSSISLTNIWVSTLSNGVIALTVGEAKTWSRTVGFGSGSVLI